MTDADAPLPLGKLPGALLGRLLVAYGTDDPAVLVGPGIGRDAAAIAIGDAVLVAKTDPITFATTAAAAYLVDVNANDLACLGATPRWLLATALLPEGITASAVEAQFAELTEACARRAISLVGGHTEVTDAVGRTVLVGLLLGETTRDRLLHPGQAQPGDCLLLTKAIALEGTALLAREIGDRLRPLVGASSSSERRGCWSIPASRSCPTRAGCSTRAVSPRCTIRPRAGWRWPSGSWPSPPVAAPRSSARRCRSCRRRRRSPARSGLIRWACWPPAACWRRRGRRRSPACSRRAARPALPIAAIGQLVPAGEGFVLRNGDRADQLPVYETDEVSRALMSVTEGT